MKRLAKTRWGQLLAVCAGALSLTLASCGSPEQGTEDLLAGSDVADLNITNSSATHEICADDLNVRNHNMEIWRTAPRGLKVRTTGRSKAAMGYTFVEIYMFDVSAHGWVAQDFLCSLGNGGDNGGDPSVPRLIKINLTQNKLYFYRNGRLERSWNVGSARAGYSTPVGQFRVNIKDPCPPYYGDGSHNIPGCSASNPLGTRALWFQGYIYGLHGTNAPGLIAEGTSAESRRLSAGCVRNNNANIEWLYNQVQVGDPIHISY